LQTVTNWREASSCRQSQSREREGGELVWSFSRLKKGVFCFFPCLLEKSVAHRLVADVWLAEEQYAQSRKRSTNSFVWSVQSSSSGVVLMCTAPPKHTQAKVGCAGPLHAAVCSSAPQCLEPLPHPPIVPVAPQDHPVHLLAATQHGCARSEQNHASAKVRCVGPICAVASRSAARAIPNPHVFLSTRTIDTHRISTRFFF